MLKLIKAEKYDEIDAFLKKAQDGIQKTKYLAGGGPVYGKYAKQIAKLFRIIEDSPASEHVTIKWYYDEEDIDMLKTGKRYEKLMKLKFIFEEVKDEDEDE